MRHRRAEGRAAAHRSDDSNRDFRSFSGAEEFRTEEEVIRVEEKLVLGDEVEPLAGAGPGMERTKVP